ncbi:VAMP-associated protein [Dendrothele bispora CBS 962.96]|uniref:VAMP-associated protein n=1 Tax=Dendrothele bispora (strain CBS 962.96) TaxID=1314807 RepID=A0A4V4HH03_DENBC|nr:VAMP-associated protein [Dendrothele bispora CBS 962.96]
MSVYLNPSSSLGFHRPLTTLVKRALTITNPNAQPVAFKVKTTAPKLYCVRPNSGRIEPGQSVEVSVMLQALKEEPPLTAKCKDKFLIQSTAITPEKESKPLQEIWTVPEGATDDANKVHQQKLRVVYLPPEGERLDEEDETAVNQSSIINVTQYDTVRQHSSVNGHTMPDFENDTSSVHPQPEDYTESHDEPQQAPPSVSVFVQPPVESERPAAVIQPEPETEPAAAPAPVPAPAPAPAPPTIVREVSAPAPVPIYMPTPSSTLSEELKEARAEIDRLRSLLAAAQPPQELRHRSRAMSDDGTVVSGTDVDTIIDEPPMQQEGVPLQVVVIIALGVFVTTYLFF